MSGTHEIFDQKTKSKTIEAALESCCGGKNSMYVMNFFFFLLKPNMSPAILVNEENEAVPSGQGRSQEITSPKARLWYCKELGHIQPTLLHILN